MFFPESHKAFRMDWPKSSKSAHIQALERHAST
jgi:hypothetical protein